ncbi:MAG: hypothetical protein HC888_11565 [Candidatus Competibacteraceae bacterium]|nr:hypothetical protein [Candidatus Competibacteraceae bacterium]
MWLSNEGSHTPLGRVRVPLHWVGCDIAAEDALGDFHLVDHRDSTVVLSGTPPAPGETRMAAWFRMACDNGQLNADPRSLHNETNATGPRRTYSLRLRRMGLWTVDRRTVRRPRSYLGYGLERMPGVSYRVEARQILERYGYADAVKAYDARSPPSTEALVWNATVHSAKRDLPKPFRGAQMPPSSCAPSTPFETNWPSKERLASHTIDRQGSFALTD